MCKRRSRRELCPVLRRTFRLKTCRTPTNPSGTERTARELSAARGFVQADFTRALRRARKSSAQVLARESSLLTVWRLGNGAWLIKHVTRFASFPTPTAATDRLTRMIRLQLPARKLTTGI